MALRDNLVSWWELNETSGTRYDAHGTNHLTDNNTVGYATGKKGNCASMLIANDESLSITDASQTGLDVGSTYSWQFWGYSTGSSNNFVINKYASGAQSYAIQFGDSINAIRFYNSSESTYDFSTTIASNTWYHVVLTYSSGTLICYVNGSQVGSSASVGTLSNTTARFCLGDLDKYSGNNLDGYLDEVAVWSRVLDSTEVTSLYNSGNGMSYADTAPASTFIPRISFIM